MDGKQIKEITPEGISYLDDEGSERFIDFAECFENFKGEIITPEYWERYKKLNHLSDKHWDEYLAGLERWKRVGQRNYSAHPPFIQFFTRPMIMFEFENKNDFDKVIYLLRKAKWQTIDLT
jgi:hypothetical protein